MEELTTAINNLSTRDFWDFVRIFGSLMSIVLLFLTYFLARKINRKIDKPIIEKQLKKVYELIEVLQKTSICISPFRTLGDDTKIKFFEFKKFQNSKFSEAEIIIQKSYYEKLDFINYSNDPFVPKKIAQLLDKFNITFDTIFEEKNSEYVILGSSEEFMINEINESKDYYSPSLNSLQLKYFKDFVSYVNEINSEIDNWINNPIVDLNLK